MCDEFLKKMTNQLPDACSVQDLVKVGIFLSPQSERYYRNNNMGPPYFKLGGSRGRIIYSKDSVIEWLKNNKHETSKKENKITHLLQQPGMENSWGA